MNYYPNFTKYCQIIAKICEKTDIYRIKLRFTEEEKFLPEGDNVEVVSSLSGTPLNSNSYKFETNYQASHVSKLKDGSINGNWWVNTNHFEEVWLHAPFNQATLIKGIKITNGSDNKKYIGSMKVVAFAENGYEYLQGTYERQSTQSRIIYIKFKKPIRVKALLFESFENPNLYFLQGLARYFE